jgi:4-hydroxy-tetrahydrodipicolinate synthase
VPDPPLVISATPTPFEADGSLDLDGLRRLFQHLADSDVDGLFVAGTTGEFPALDDDERLAVIRCALTAAGPDRVIAHVGAASAYQAAALARTARAAGVARFAAITPYYLPASPRGVRSYFEAVHAETGDLPLYAYLIPRYSGTEVTSAALATVIDEVGLAGAKLSIPGTDFLADVARRVGSATELYSGNDALIREVAAVGGHGVVSGVSPACPDLFTALARAVYAADPDAIASCQRPVDDAVAALGPSLSFLKAALVDQGVIASARCRLAADPPTAAHHALITAAYRQPA